ncbi:MAG: chemotaxis protein CheA [Desulfobacterales bacterium]|nr:chemotaxis protein CheA [Desulfobacterales bacterium]
MLESYDEGFINDFIAECKDHVEAIEPDLLVLEKECADVSPEIINRIFRAMHSIKGSSGFFKITPLINLSHAMENILMKIRDGELVPNAGIIDALLAGSDKIRIMLNDIKSVDNVSYEAELYKLNAILKIEDVHETQDVYHFQESDDNIDADVVIERLQGGKFLIKVKGPENFGVSVFEMTEEMLSSICNARMNIYIIFVCPNKDFKGVAPYNFFQNKSSFGKWWHNEAKSKIHECILKNDDFYSFIYATILEHDIISDALEIPINQIKEISSQLFNPSNAVESIPQNKDVTEKKSLPEPELKQKIEPKADLTNAPSSDDTLKNSKIENKPSDIGAKLSSSETIRVSVDLIDRLMNLAGELVLGRNQLRQELEKLINKDPKFGTLIQSVDVVTSEIQEYIMQMRMQALGTLFSKFPRIVRDLSKQLSKEAELIIEGKEVELDKSIIEGLSDPLTHLIRNSLDHGIEIPDEREKSGKQRKGVINLKAFHEGGQVNIVVSDDGKGINPLKIVEKAISKGIITPDAASLMTDIEKINIILLPGFSTAETVTDISGRGVGMDVVKTNIEKLGGHLDITSIPGKGSSVKIRLPLTLAIIPSLIVGASGVRFAIPQVNVQELVMIMASDVGKRIEKIGGSIVLKLRERLLPLLSLSDILCLEKKIINSSTGEEIIDRRKQILDRRYNSFLDNDQEENNEKDALAKKRKLQGRRKSFDSNINVVVLRIGTNSFGLVVDELFDNEEIVVKPLSKHIKDCKCFAGATIMGDGRVAMILDAAGISEYSKLRFNEIKAEQKRRQELESMKKKSSMGEMRSIILFNNAWNEYFALPLSTISRLEKISSNAVHSMGKHTYIDYFGKGLPLVYLNNLLPVDSLPENLNEFYLIIPKTKEYSFGIVASQIIDTMETDALIHKDISTPKGISGSAFVEGHLTMFLNISELFKLVEKETI